MPVEVRLVADAGEDAGFGHLARSSALAAALGSRRLHVDCLAAGASAGLELDGIRWRPLRGLGEIAAPPVPAVLVLDSYRLPLDAVVPMVAPSRLVVFRDSSEVPEGVTLVVDVAGYPDGQGELTGLDYASLRSDFWGLPRRRLEDRVERVLVTTGAGDPGGLGEDLARSAREALGGARVTIVRGRYADVDPPPGVDLLDAPQSLLGPLLAADVVVSAAGQTMLEAAAAGTPCVALALADNQRRQATRLAELGIVRLVDPPGAVDVREGLAELAAKPDLRREMSAKGQCAVDGFGALRIAFHVSRLVSRAT